MVKGKMVFDSITRRCGFEYKEARKLKAINMQISGLKAVLLQVKLAKDIHEYVAQTIGRTVYFPTAAKYI